MFDQWQKESTIGTDVKVDEFENDIPFWFSYPERNVSTGEMPCNSLDCSHIFKTHLKSFYMHIWIWQRNKWRLESMRQIQRNCLKINLCYLFEDVI